jgi:hypothetical protein
LFREITDEPEDCPEGDESWLVPVLRVLGTAPPSGRRLVAGVLCSIMQDHMITARERRRVDSALQAVGAEPWDPYEVTPDEAGALDRAAVPRDGAALVLAYRSA